MWDMIVDAISNLIGGAGQAAGSAGSAVGSGLEWLGQNAGSVLGAAGGTASALAPFLMQQGQSNMGPQSLLAPQAGTPQGNQVAARGQMAQLQSQGLSGASPDFYAQMLGLTPEELERLMGRQSQGAA